MRYIDITRYRPPTDWAGKVVTATNNLSLNSTYIPIWRDLADTLNSLVRNDRQRKCWYSEVLVLGSDIDVDHFRPKSNVKGLTSKYANLESGVWADIEQRDRLGYRFLAFAWQNFRMACKHTNTGRVDQAFTKGKQDFFPLRVTSAIASNTSDLVNEEISLLDPCNAQDPELLKFSPDGNVDASYPMGTWEYTRAKVSIEVYHLNYDLRGLNDARLEKWNECVREINHLIKLYDSKRNDLIPSQFQKITQFIKKESLFSAVAVDCIRHYARQDSYFYIRPLANRLTK